MFKKIVLSLLVLTLHFTPLEILICKNRIKVLSRFLSLLLLTFLTGLTLYTYVSSAELTARITLVTGPVEVKTADAWKKAEKNMTLNEKDEVRTGPGGRVVLTLSDGSRMNLQENSNLVLTALGENNVQVAMNAGTMNAKVKKMGAAGKFSIDTPASVCAVRGTNFTISAGERDTSVECYRGSVNVKKSGSLEETLLSRWQKIQVSQDKPLGRAVAMNKEEKNIVLAPVRNEFTQEVRMGMSREAVQAAAAQEIKKAEYQQGKSLIDAFGKRVRLEEYIVRPNPDQFKMVVLNERENRFDYFTWKATFDKNLPTDLTEATKWLSWDSGTNPPAYYLTANETAASNTIDVVEWGWTGGHIVDNSLTASQKYEHLYDNYNFKINNTSKISYEPKSGTDIKNIVTEVNFKICGNLVTNCVTIDDQFNTDLNSFVSTYNQLYNPDITSADAQNYWAFNTWWNSNVATLQPSGNKLEHYRLQANLPGQSFLGNKIYNEDYYLIDDNGKIATTEQTKGLFDYATQKWNKNELLKWNQELVMSGDDFNGPDKKIDLVVEPKIFIDAGIVDAK